MKAVLKAQGITDIRAIPLSNLPLEKDDSLTNEILEIYPGVMYQDDAVSELSLIVAQ